MAVLVLDDLHVDIDEPYPARDGVGRVLRRDVDTDERGRSQSHLGLNQMVNQTNILTAYRGRDSSSETTPRRWMTAAATAHFGRPMALLPTSSRSFAAHNDYERVPSSATRTH